jgi:integrase
MTQSKTVGLVKIRPQVKNGAETGKWFVDVPSSLTSNGKRKRKLLDSKKQALDAARELKAAINPVTGLLKVRNSDSSITLDQAIQDWREEQQRRVETLKKRESTYAVETYRFRAMEAYFSGDKLASLTENRLVEYQAYRLKRGIKPTTINSEISGLSFVFDWAIRNGHRLTKPVVEQIPVRATQAIVPTPEEVIRVVEHLPDNLKTVVRFLAETGCRKGEVLNLTWDCVDEIGGTAEITSRNGWTPKTQQSERVIPLNSALIEMLRSLPKTSSYVFPGKNPGSPIGDFKRAWASAVEKADIRRKGKRVHIPIKSLRKAHATWQAERGTHESVLQGLLGHAKGSRVTKRFYVQVTEQAKRNAVLSLPFANA